MITCLGLVVGVVTSTERREVLEQCAKFLYTHQYLLGARVEFKIDREVYATVYDAAIFETMLGNDEFAVVFDMWDKSTTGVSISI